MLRFKASGKSTRHLMQLAKEAIRTATSNPRKRAEYFQKNYPSLIPKVRLALVWPEETNRKWKNVMGDWLPASKYLEI